METPPLSFIILYILLPFISLVWGLVIYYLNKRIGIFGNKKAILILILSAIILGFPGLLGFVDYGFMPYIYLSLCLSYFILGIYNLMLMDGILQEIKNKGFLYESIFLITQMILGAGLFSLLFNLCNELRYGLWACTCIMPYFFVSLYRQTFRCFVSIPLEIYKVWEYSPENKLNKVNFNNCNDIIKIELSKYTEEHIRHRIIAKSKDDLIFKEWFQYVLEDYNEKFPADKIECYDIHRPFGWIFYVKPSFFSPRRYIDPDLTIQQNKINRPYIIMARRVRNEIQTSNR